MKLLNIQKVTKTIAAGCLLLSTAACDVTDLQPANALPESEVYTDAQSIEGAMIGMYNAAQSGTYAGAVIRGYPFGAASVEQGDLRGEDMYNHQLFYEITYTNSQTPASANNVYMWLNLYRLINRTNLVREGVEEALENEVLDQETADAYIGETLAMRAMAHHELLIFFSRPYSDNPENQGVPYRQVAINATDQIEEALENDRGTVAEAYANILADLDQAEQLLPAAGVNTRFTKGAAIALKNRVKLHMGDWAGVVEEYTKLAALGVYNLETSPDGAFRSGNSSEMILAMDNSEVSNPGTNGALAAMYGDPDLNGRGLVKISPVVWRSEFWLADDLRRTLLTSLNESETDFAGYYTTKYTGYGVFNDPTPLVRYAEVLLNTAEAYARLGQTAEGLPLLNSVRDRALANAAASYTGFASGDELLQAVLNERRIELLAEGKRWADIHRLSGEGLLAGIPAKAGTRSIGTLAAYQDATFTLAHSLPYEDNRFIWPIPLEETLNNSTLAAQQNPGY